MNQKKNAKHVFLAPETSLPSINLWLCSVWLRMMTMKMMTIWSTMMKDDNNVDDDDDDDDDDNGNDDSGIIGLVKFCGNYLVSQSKIPTSSISAGQDDNIASIYNRFGSKRGDIIIIIIIISAVFGCTISFPIDPATGHILCFQRYHHLISPNLHILMGSNNKY